MIAAALPVSGYPAAAPKSARPPAPADLNIRIVGTASFQGRQTALVEDLNTHSDSFYKVGDPIYGYKITAIGADGIDLEKDGQHNFVAFEPSTLRAVAGEDKSGGPVVANTYLPETSFRQMAWAAPNFYTGPGRLGDQTQWDLFSPRNNRGPGKLPAMSGDLSIASAASGLFSMPLATFKRLSSGFGYRKHPIGGGSKMHKGLDLSADRGTRILAADNGTVTWSGWKGGYGYCIIVDHHNGYETLYGHCSKLIADVGDNVRKSDLLAEVGSTGASTGNHLHFEVHKNGTPVDPEPYLANYL
jgi:murein DD-endopeptidase MepM/ murein hydrolase activator NlpD